MSTQEQRERFEAWATKANFDVERYGISPGYQDTHTDDAWVAWQAAEAASIERCAKIAESELRVWDTAAPDPQQRIASKIRALLPKEE